MINNESPTDFCNLSVFLDSLDLLIVLYKKTAKEPVIVLSTASPFKFPHAVLSALGETPAENEFDCLTQLAEVSNLPIPQNLAGLKDAKVLHNIVIEKEDLIEFALKKAGQAQW